MNRRVCAPALHLIRASLILNHSPDITGPSQSASLSASWSEHACMEAEAPKVARYAVRRPICLNIDDLTSVTATATAGHISRNWELLTVGDKNRYLRTRGVRKRVSLTPLDDRKTFSSLRADSTCRCGGNDLEAF